MFPEGNYHMLLKDLHITKLSKKGREILVGILKKSTLKFYRQKSHSPAGKHLYRINIIFFWLTKSPDLNL